MKVTIKDVAREAKVATSTVSRVLSNSDRISEETKNRVNEVIKRLNYTPNIIARGLANKKTRMLAIVLPKGAEDSFSNPFFVQAMKGISVYAQKEEYYIMYAFNENNDSEEWIKRITDSNLVDGICLLSAKDNDETIEYLKKIKFPFVVIGRPEDVENVLWVDNDNFQAMYSLVQKLIEKGHKKIAYIGAKSELNVSKDRLNGYRQALYSRDIEVNEDIILEMNDFTENEGSKATKRLINIALPTSIVTTDDLLAFGVQEVLKELDIENISVVGFNNIPLANYKKPALTSVDINAEKLGYYATKLLIDKLEGKNMLEKYHIIETNLIERESFKVNESNASDCIENNK